MASRSSYELAPMDGSEGDEEPFLDEKRPWKRSATTTDKFNKVMAFLNVVLALTLATSLALASYSWTAASTNSDSKCNAVTDPLEPYSPALEAVHPVIKKFKPNLVYQSETSDAVEAAWMSILGEGGGSFIALSPEVSAKLGHESVESLWEPGMQVYGLSMYHQLHCLNTIRKSFYREKFFSDMPNDRFHFHKNHCFDFLRQVIMCHGDISMTYWWNKNYTISDDETGRESHSKWFESLSPDERATNSSVFWDVEHSCRMFEPIDEWGKRHAALPKGYSFDSDGSHKCVTPLCKGELHDAAPASSVGDPESV
ncbi:MAG: hypothetical protein Q9169_007963 [Polycauliona sp. 2 TL-2023]